MWVVSPVTICFNLRLWKGIYITYFNMTESNNNIHFIRYMNVGTFSILLDFFSLETPSTKSSRICLLLTNRVSNESLLRWQNSLIGFDHLSVSRWFYRWNTVIKFYYNSKIIIIVDTFLFFGNIMVAPPFCVLQNKYQLLRFM